MNLKTAYKTLIWTGLLLFIAGTVGDANAIQYLSHGTIYGPVLFGIGTVVWIPLRIKKPILHPFNRTEYRSTFDALFAFMFNNFLLEFWAFCCAFGMLIVIGGGTAMKRSVGFRVAVAKIQGDERLTKQIGEFRGTGTLVAGSTSSSQANLNFSAYGTNGGTRVNIELKKELGDWKVNSLEFKQYRPPFILICDEDG